MEVWKQSKYENYKVSNQGSVLNIKTGKLLTQSLGRSNGYYKVTLYLGKNDQKIIEVHRLVAETFKPNTVPGLVVDHIDGNKLNNHESNLQFITQQENMAKARAKRERELRLTQEQIDEVISMFLSGKSCIQITIDMNEKYSRRTSRATYTRIIRAYQEKQ